VSACLHLPLTAWLSTVFVLVRHLHWTGHVGSDRATKDGSVSATAALVQRRRPSSRYISTGAAASAGLHGRRRRAGPDTMASASTCTTVVSISRGQEAAAAPGAAFVGTLCLFGW
jgi:hypothetical protein